ncbi:MAG: alpha/beta hydrolase [Candidatus Contendobacter odensis]|uniref:Alpha/beta hydrolase n=1 Tax=Candidatus Contendibacter odensensis TaxID=1400860 RepID=A0A2G6PE72_9GAMM|nr:MAG: alpha/beta hydrolase [Candidatus Contendobacter odensis]
MNTIPHHHDFDIHTDYHRLHALRLSPPQAANHPTLVFLHEGLGSIRQWSHFPEQLCDLTHLPGLVYERHGHGQSETLTHPRSCDYLHQEAQDYLPAVLSTCHITEPPILFGHSDGGSIALLYAAACPDKVRAIVIEAAHVFVEEASLYGIRAACQSFEQGHLYRKLQRYHGDNTETMFRGWSNIWLHPDFRDWRIEKELQAITCPVLIVQGEDDEYGTRAQVDTIANSITGPSEILWLPHCGHTPHHQLRETVLEATAGFINQYIC